VANSARRRAFELGVWLPSLAVSLLAACYEVVFRQTDAYLGPALSLPRSASISCGVVGFALGAWLGNRWAQRYARASQLLVWLSAALSVSLSLSGAAWFAAFAWPMAMPFVALGLPAVVASLAGATLATLANGGWLAYRELGSITLLLAPLPLLTGALVAVAGAIALSHAGLWRAAIALALTLTLTTSAARRFHDFLCDAAPPTLGASALALAVASASLVAAQAYVPPRLVATYPSEVVWSDRSGEAVVVSAQNTLQLFQAHQLRLTSADDYRLAELAVHPALTNLRAPRRVLLLGPAGGLLEREALRYPTVTRVVSVAEGDGASFRRALWSARRGATQDPRLRFVDAEILPWLEQHTDPFDAIVVSLPAPVSYREGKHYTRYFFELLAARLGPRGVLAVQAPSRASLPQTFATIHASLRAANLHTAGYEAPVPLLGALSFLLARREAISLELQGLPSGLQYLSRGASYLHPLAQDQPAPLTTLDHLRAVELWHTERSAAGDP
jgi:spermidine synthase